MEKLKLIEQTIVRDDLPHFEPGDTVNVHYRVREGDKERIQQYKGIVISYRGSGSNKTFTVRKISGNIGVERIFPLYSPFIAKIDVVKKGKVRRSKLYYLRNLQGRAARIQEKEAAKKREAAVREAAAEASSEQEPAATEKESQETTAEQTPEA